MQFKFNEMRPGELRELFRLPEGTPEYVKTYFDVIRDMMKTWVEDLTPEQEEKLYRFFALWQCVLDISFHYDIKTLTAEKAMKALDMAEHIGGVFRPLGASVDHLLIHVDVLRTQNGQETEVISIPLDGKSRPISTPLDGVEVYINLDPKNQEKLEQTRDLISALRIDRDLAGLCKDGSISAQEVDHLKLQIKLLQDSYQSVLQIVENLSAPTPVGP
jgi:hypothetical protein